MQPYVCRVLQQPAGLRCIKRGLYNYTKYIDILPEVKDAFECQKPLVALESTIISHGMPYPENLKTTLEVQQIIKSQGAVPVTIAILNGRIKAGLDETMLTEYASMKEPIVKTSRRDFPYVLSKGLNGGTTVAGTMLVANLLGISIFATGGIGGVHRGGEDSFDISADLIELGRTPVAVVSSGVKSILDIGRTLEYLETQGVCVVTYGSTKAFPSFYTRNSGYESPYCVETPIEVAGLISKLHDLELNSGLLLAVPVPQENEMEGGAIEAAIAKALQKCEADGVKGKEVTPYILKEVSNYTEGNSLQSNIALIKNNAKVAAQVAVELQKLKAADFKRNHILKSSSSTYVGARRHYSTSTSPVVIGGSVLDLVASVTEDAISANGSTHRGKIRFSGGGVGRNIADALGKLDVHPFLISAVGTDLAGQFLLQETLSHLNPEGILVINEARTASYNAIIEKTGECHFGIGDMDIHSCITPQLVEQFSSTILKSPLVIIDGNIPVETLDCVLRLCYNSKIPVWFEPTDIRKAANVFGSEFWSSLSFISPNLKELKIMHQAAGLPLDEYEKLLTSEKEDKFKHIASIARSLVHHIGNAIVTLGKEGIMIVREGTAENPLLQCNVPSISKKKISARHYAVPRQLRDDKEVNVSGAGDCLAAGMMAAMLHGLPEAQCVSAGFAMAYQSLHVASAVPGHVTIPQNPEPAKFNSLPL